ncbi:unnamed protein product [Mytilus edulis]|uniref:Apolipoprotein L3 n=1 Tax=Mytilus edulis TaxID=6550 RepID=A0A8S3QJS8_MYTED|nr:unnamed protein product [Mytilus edulis]
MGDRKEKAILALEAVVKEMDSSEFTDNVTQIVGSGVSVAGAAAVLGGLLLAPFTGGVSAIVSIGGVVAGVAGGITNLTSDKIKENYALSKLKEAEDIIYADQERSQKLEKAEQNMHEALVVLKGLADDSGTDIKVYLKTASGTSKTLNVAKIVEKTLKGVRGGIGGVTAGARAAGKLLGKLSIGLAVVGAGFDIWSIVSNSQDIAQGSKSAVGIKITEHIKALKESLKEVQKNYS